MTNLGLTAILGGAMAACFGLFYWVKWGKHDEDRTMLGAYAAVGAITGFLIGMSESPLLAGAITGGVALVGVALGKIWDQATVKTERKTEFRSEAKTETETVTNIEKVRAAFSYTWLLLFAYAMFVGVLAGATVRINNLLDFEEHRLPAKLRALGFDESQVASMMKRYAETFAAGKLHDILKTEESGLRAAEMETKSKPNAAQANKHVAFSWEEFWDQMSPYDINTPEGAKHVLNTLLDAQNPGKIPEAFRDVMDFRRKSETDTNIVRTLKQFTGDSK